MAKLKYWNGTVWSGVDADAITDGTNTITPDDIGNLTNLNTTDKSSLVGATNEVNSTITTHINNTTNPHNVTTIQIGAETPSGSQAKADTAQTNANSYTDQQISNIAGVGRTTETVKGNADALTSHLSDYVYQVAGGTATAITLTISGSLENGYPITFIASADNSGSATTINTKSVYKPNTTDAPNFIAGKAYTVWYDEGDDCFFIKASAEGDAVAANVLASTTFSNDTDTGIAGTMVDRSGENTASNYYAPGGGKLSFLAPEGYYDGTNDTVALTDADFVATNIRNGVNLFAITGTLLAYIAASETIQYSNTTGGTTITFYTIPVSRKGTIRITFTLQWLSEGAIYGRVNGVNSPWCGYSSDSPYGPVTYTYSSLAVSPGDMLGFYATGGARWNSVYVKYTEG